MAHQAKVHDLAMVGGDQHLEQEVQVTAGCPLVEMHVTDWAKAQREDPTLSTVLDWLKAQKQASLKMLLAEHTPSEEGELVLWNRKNFSIHQEAMYLCLTPKGETEDLVFGVLKAHCVATLIGHHWDPGHQQHDHTVLAAGTFLVAGND